MAASRVKSSIAALYILLMAITILMPHKASAEIDPKYGVYVQDAASMLQQQTQDTLYGNAVWINSATGSAQIGVVTMPALGDQSIEEYAVAKLRELGLGSKERDDGVLIVYAAKEKRVRIEVGYGLEGRIPDGKAGAILDKYFLPNMKAGAVDQAFTLTQAAIIQEIAAEYNIDISNGSSAPLPDNQYSDQQGSGFLNGIPGYLKIIFIVGIGVLIFLDFKFTGGMFTLSILSLLGRGGRGGGSGGGWGGRGGGGSSGGGGASR